MPVYEYPRKAISNSVFSERTAIDGMQRGTSVLYIIQFSLWPPGGGGFPKQQISLEVMSGVPPQPYAWPRIPMDGFEARRDMSAGLPQKSTCARVHAVPDSSCPLP
jgi:hypothetical protein